MSLEDDIYEEMLERIHKLETENKKLREYIKNKEWNNFTGLKKPIWALPEEIEAEKVNVTVELINGDTEHKIVIH